MRLPLLFLALLLAPAVAHAQRCPDKLPAGVESTREAIVTAAKARDWKTLGALAGKGPFMAGNPNRDDPLAYWQQLTREGTDVPNALVAIFGMRCGVMVESGGYVFPLASAMEWRGLKKSEKKALKKFYGKGLETQFRGGQESGHYVGWRGVIEKDGRWSAFLSGE